ncbi:MAG TPA: M3 family oligoendopeptidase, partial [bacterium]|nr:M3 family oligoendopeptidase [bacterium]
MASMRAQAARFFTQEPPRDGQAFMHVEWASIEPFFNDLLAVELAADNVSGWLSAWSWLSNVIDESYARLHVATTVDTEDKEAEKHHRRFLEAIYPPALTNEQKLKEKLLASGLEPDGFALPLHHMRAEAELFREANLPLITQEQNLVTELNKIYGAQTVEWEDAEVTLVQLTPVYQDTDRARRERAWRLSMDRWLADRGKINDVWKRFLALRKQMAANAGQGDYR